MQQNSADDFPMLTEAQVARRLGLSAAALRTWRSRGVGPRFCRFGRSVRYRQGDVEGFVRANAVPAQTREQQNSQPNQRQGPRTIGAT